MRRPIQPPKATFRITTTTSLGGINGRPAGAGGPAKNRGTIFWEGLCLMTLSRRSILGCALGASYTVCIPRYAAGAAEFNYKLSTTVAVSDTMALHALDVASKIYRESNGRLDIRVYPNSVLGGNVGELEQLRLGAL